MRPFALTTLALAAAFAVGGCEKKTVTEEVADKAQAVQEKAVQEKAEEIREETAKVEGARPAGTPATETAEAPAPESPARVGAGVPAFQATAVTWTEGQPAEAALDSRATERPTVYIVTSTTCPFVNGYAARIRAVEAEYAAKGVDFVHVYPNSKESPEEKAAFHQEKGFHGAMVVDVDANVAKLLGAQRTPEVYVVSADGTVVYHGGVDDHAAGGNVKSAYLCTALDEHLAGKPVTSTETPAPG